MDELFKHLILVSFLLFLCLAVMCSNKSRADVDPSGITRFREIPEAEARCSHDRIFRLICTPACVHQEIGLCVYECGGMTDNEERTNLSLSVWRVGISANCRAEMKAGWKPPEWLMRRLREALRTEVTLQ